MQRTSKLINWPTIIFLLIQNFVSSETFWVLGLIYCVYEIFKNYRGKVFIPFKEFKLLFVFLIWGALLGFMQYMFENIYLIDLIRDVFYYTNPIIFIFMGASFAKNKEDIYKILNSFILSSAIISLSQLFQVISNRNLLNAVDSVYGWRGIIGDGTVVMGISLAISISGVLPKEKCFSKPLLFLFNMITGVYFAITMSRTVVLVMIIMYLVLVLNKANAKIVLRRLISIIVLFTIGIFALNSFLPSGLFSAYIQKLIASFTETSISHSWSTYAEVQSNWRGYETYCAINQWKKIGILQQLFGLGFGARIFVGGYAYSLLRQTIMGNPADSIAVLHNGYATQLIKLGVLGVGLYVVLYIKLINKARRFIKKQNELEGRLLLGVSMVLLLQTYFLNGLFKDYCFFPMMILIGFCGYRVERKEQTINV